MKKLLLEIEGTDYFMLSKDSFLNVVYFSEAREHFDIFILNTPSRSSMYLWILLCSDWMAVRHWIRVYRTSKCDSLFTQPNEFGGIQPRNSFESNIKESGLRESLQNCNLYKFIFRLIDIIHRISLCCVAFQVPCVLVENVDLNEAFTRTNSSRFQDNPMRLTGTEENEELKIRCLGKYGKFPCLLQGSFEMRKMKEMGTISFISIRDTEWATFKTTEP